jgi:hypothetical protein
MPDSAPIDDLIIVGKEGHASFKGLNQRRRFRP